MPLLVRNSSGFTGFSIAHNTRSKQEADAVLAEVKRAGGKLLRRGEFGPGLPFAYVTDPDGYEIELWFE